MAGVYPFEGASRQIYVFHRSTRENFAADPVPQGGLYVFARNDGAIPVIIFAGDAASLSREALASEPWGSASREYRANLFYFRVNTDVASRKRELNDLIAKHQPVLNTDQHSVD